MSYPIMSPLHDEIPIDGEEKNRDMVEEVEEKCEYIA
jgi:hypothetical protein